MNSKISEKDLLKSKGIWAKKKLGQHFLINKEIIPEIVKIAEIKQGDKVIEIGSGTGVLTEELIRAGAEVFAIEKDYKLIEILRKKFSNTKTLKIIHQDALFFDISRFKNYKVVANIPFNITSPIIRKFLTASNKPQLIVLMIQREVAERLVAEPGSSKRGLLTILVELFGQVSIEQKLSNKDFWPKPKVESAVIKIKPRESQIKDTEIFLKLVKMGFSSKRRQIHNSLFSSLKLEKKEILKLLEKSQIEPKLRAEDLNLEQWINLWQTINKDSILK